MDSQEQGRAAPAGDGEREEGGVCREAKETSRGQGGPRGWQPGSQDHPGLRAETGVWPDPRGTAVAVAEGQDCPREAASWSTPLGSSEQGTTLRLSHPVLASLGSRAASMGQTQRGAGGKGSLAMATRVRGHRREGVGVPGCTTSCSWSPAPRAAAVNSTRNVPSPCEGNRTALLQDTRKAQNRKVRTFQQLQDVSSP